MSPSSSPPPLSHPPLQGLKVLEFAGLAPSPFCGMFLADYGAEVLRLDKPTQRGAVSQPIDKLTRHKSSLILNLKNPSSITFLKKLIQSAPIDALIDPFRPGVLERLGFSPPVLSALNPRLIYLRLTGYRYQDSIFSQMAGHDINYLSVSGALSLLGRKNEKPYAPANFLADFAAGGMMGVIGILLALFEREKSGLGQVVDVNMVDGVQYITSYARYAARDKSSSLWRYERGDNLLDGGAPFYDVYRCKTGNKEGEALDVSLENKKVDRQTKRVNSNDTYMAVGALEDRFYEEFVKGLFPEQTERNSLPHRYDRKNWNELRRQFEERFATKTRKEWEAVFTGTDACVTPVLELDEVADEDEGVMKEAVRLNRSPGKEVKEPSTTTDHALGLIPGSGGVELVQRWTGWRGGGEFIGGGAGDAEGVRWNETPLEKAKL